LRPTTKSNISKAARTADSVSQILSETSKWNLS